METFKKIFGKEYVKVKLSLLWLFVIALFGCNNNKNEGNIWAKNQPEMLWSTENLPAGHASVCVVDGLIYSTGMKDSSDICVAIGKDGEVLWQTEYGRAWNGSYPESRCTPAFSDGKLYVSSGYGDVACLDANSGNIRWQVKGYETWDIIFCTWGIAESLIVHENMVIFNPIGKKTTTVALNKNTGEQIWESESINDSAAYVSPILVKYANKNMLINVGSANIYGVDLANGKILWTFKYHEVHTPQWSARAPINNCTSPLFHDNRIYVTSGYNHCGVMLELNKDASRAELVWSDTILDNHHGGVVKVGDYIYGSNWISNANGNWVCLDWKTGEKKWEQKWNTKGTIISKENRVLIVDERKGNVGLLKATSEKFYLMGSFKIPLGKGPFWSYPVIKDDVLYLRHNEALMAYKMNNIF